MGNTSSQVPVYIHEQTQIEMYPNQLCPTWCWGYRGEGDTPYLPLGHSWPSGDAHRQADRRQVMSALRQQHRKGILSLCVAGEGTQEGSSPG